MFSRNFSAVIFARSRTELNVADDDLALLLRELADLVAAATAAAAAGHRLRRLVVLAERPDLHEVDVARRRLRAGHAVVVGRLGVVGDEVARLEAQLLEVDGVRGGHFRAAPCAPPNRLTVFSAPPFTE